MPGAIQQSFPGYHGVAWYWQRFVPALAPDATQRAQLHFEGVVRYLGEVWLNGQFLGGYEGGEGPFDLDATGAIQADQENRLVVRVLCPGSEPIDGYVSNEVPMTGDYGGIMLPVAYRLVPAVRTVDIFVRPNPHDGCVPATVVLRNDTQNTLHVRLSMQIRPRWQQGRRLRMWSTRPWRWRRASKPSS